MRNYLQLQNELKFLGGNNSPAYDEQIKYAINDTYLDVCLREKWSWRLKQDSIVTTAPYETGNVTDVTNGGTTVTGSGTTWTSAMIGRRIRIGSDSQSYEISAVGGSTSLTLLNQYDGSTITATNTSYSIYQSFYKLARDFETFQTIKQQTSPLVLVEWARQSYERSEPSPQTSGTVYYYINAGTTRTPFYNTGTVAVTNGSTTITGSSTTWTSDMVGMSFRVQGETDDYKITAFGSTTSLTIDRGYAGATQAGSTTIKYEIDPAGIRQIELYNIPSASKVIPYWYYYKPLRLVNDWDIPVIQPDTYHDILLLGTKARLNLSDWTLFEKRLTELKASDKLSDEILVMGTFAGETGAKVSVLPSNYPAYY